MTTSPAGRGKDDVVSSLEDKKSAVCVQVRPKTGHSARLRRALRLGGSLRGACCPAQARARRLRPAAARRGEVAFGKCYSAPRAAAIACAATRLACVQRVRAASGLQRTAQRGCRTETERVSRREVATLPGRERYKLRRRAALAVTLRNATARLARRAAWFAQRSSGLQRPPPGLHARSL